MEGSMRKLAVLLTAAAVIVISAGVVDAQQTPGWYIGGQGGWTNLNSENPTFTTGGGGVFPFSANYDAGWNAGGTVGYEWPMGVRLEGEATYRQNNFSNITGPMGLGVAPVGNVHSLALMANAIYDFMPNNRWTPYLGAGVGAANDTVSNVTLLGITSNSANSWEFAYQGIAGVKFAATPQISLALDFRYFGTTTPSYSIAGGTWGNGGYNTENIMLNIAYHFGAPSPPPPPPPPPAAQPAPPAPAPRTFIVYFDFDKASLTPEGTQVIQNASDAFRQTGVARIQVAGYTDLTGTQQYNLALSRRRADAVHAQLVHDGVPDAAISETWHGMENPAVPTALGVREPRNRRVEIIL
jgi:outer membrane protein OmpA-like peptidoglycan-associated protein